MHCERVATEGRVGRRTKGANVQASEGVRHHSKSGAPLPRVGQVRSWVDCEQCR